MRVFLFIETLTGGGALVLIVKGAQAYVLYTQLLSHWHAREEHT